MVGRGELVFECPYSTYSSKTREGKGKEVLGDKQVGALFSEILAPLSILTSLPQVQTMIRISRTAPGSPAAFIFLYYISYLNLPLELSSYGFHRRQ